MTHDRNIALLLTPPQPAAIAVVRLIGPDVNAFLTKHFNKALPLGRCVHGTLSAGDQTIDDPLIIRQCDYADINLHGGPWIVRSVLDLAEQFGFEVCDRLAIPLPTSVVEGVSATEKSVLAAVPLATTELALRRLLEQPAAWKALGAPERAGPSSARSGAGTPYEQPNPDLRAMADDWELWWLLHPPLVVIAGITNVGKSTLANRLFAQERSITADLPGTTRDWVGDMADIDGLAVHLIDTPGIRATNDPIESEAIARADSQLERADLVLLVLDASVPIAEQVQLLERYPGAIRIINKSDLTTGEMVEAAGIGTVATSGVGVDQVRAAISKRFHVGRRSGEPKWWTMEQREVLLTGVLPSFD